MSELASSVRGVSQNHMAKRTAKSRQDGGRLNTGGEQTRFRSIHNGEKTGEGERGGVGVRERECNISKLRGCYVFHSYSNIINS